MIAVSILGIKDQLKQKIECLNKLNISYLHLDIMDGLFVENINDNYELLKQSLINNQKKLDVHLMVKDVEFYINKYKKLNPDIITFHIEASNDPLKLINLIKMSNIKVGISINPSTNIDAILPFLDKIDVVLVMTVVPGKGGQPFMEEVLPKIEKLKELKKDYHFILEVDGGINDKTFPLVDGVDIKVVGSYITSSNDYEERINRLYE